MIYLFTSRNDMTDMFYEKRGYKRMGNMILLNKTLGE